MIFLVEDDPNIRELVLYTLNHSGLKAAGFDTPSSFWQALKAETPDLILLDIMLPQEDGISILKKLRASADTAALPIMLLTAKDAEYDKVLGLDNGADDYVTKPFGMMELTARIKALLRRVQPRSAAACVYGRLTVDPERHTVTADGRPVAVTVKEFDLLALMIRHPGRVFDRDTLLAQVWGYTFDGENRTVDVHVRTLRQKLGDCAGYIETIRGVGYKLGGDER